MSIYSILLLSMAQAMANAQECSESSIETCNSIMSVYTAESLFPTAYGQNGLTEACRQFDAFKKCLAPFRDTCSEPFALLFTAHENASDYVCNVNSQGYGKTWQCLTQQKLLLPAMTCNDTYTGELLQAALELQQTFDDAAAKRKLCSALNEFVTCTSMVALEYCGGEAGIVVLEYKLRSHRNDALITECELTRPDPSLFTTPAPVTDSATQKADSGGKAAMFLHGSPAILVAYTLLLLFVVFRE